MILENYVHSNEDVVDCYTMHLKDICCSKGILLSGPMCFGLSAALSFSYWMEKTGKIPFTVMIGRKMNGLDLFFKKLGIGFQERTVVDKTEFRNIVAACLERKALVLCYTDRFYLSYLKERYGYTHFGLHMIGICGIKYEGGVVFYAVSDFISQEFIWCAEDEINMARNSPWKPFSPEGRIILVDHVLRSDTPMSAIKELIEPSIQDTCSHMLSGKDCGVSAMSGLCRDLEGLLEQDISKLSHAIRFQLKLLKAFIDEFENTHSFYRKIFSDFLHQCIYEYDICSLRGMDIISCEISQKWIDLSKNLIFDSTPVKENILCLIKNLKEIIGMEGAFYQCLQNNLKNKITT